MLKSTKSALRIVVYFPFSVIEDTHLIKDLHLARSLSDLGHEVTLVAGLSALTQSGMARLNSVEVKVTRNSVRQRLVHPLGYPKEIYQMCHVMFEIEPDAIIMLHIGPIGVLLRTVYELVRRIAILGGRKYQETVFILKSDTDGSPLVTEKNRAFWRIVLKACSITFNAITVESTCALTVLKRYALPIAKLCVVRNGYANSIFYPRRCPGIKRSNTVICVARVTRVKGLEVLIGAFGMLRSSYPDWKLLIVGHSDDRVYQSYLDSLIARLGIGDSVEFVGHVSPETLAELYSMASIFCLPSRREGSPISRTEAAACGLPLVITEAGCGLEYVGRGALVIPTANPARMSAALTSLMSDPDLRSRLSNEGLRHVQSWDQVARAYSDMIYDHLSRAPQIDLQH